MGRPAQIRPRPGLFVVLEPGLAVWPIRRPRVRAPHPHAPARRARNAWRTARSRRDRKSTRLNSSHSSTSYAVFCLKKKRSVELRGGGGAAGGIGELVLSLARTLRGARRRRLG